MAPIRYSLHYEDYSEHLMSRFGKLLQMQSLVDMTLMCSSHTLRVHKTVLAASSAYFQEILPKQTGEPLVILKMRFSVLKCLVEFMYCGKTQCLEENLDELVSAAQFLKIKGLSKVTKEGLGITSNNELPIFSPPVVISQPPQSIIDLNLQENDHKGTTDQATLLENNNLCNKDMVVRIPFDIENGGATSSAEYPEGVRAGKSRRGRFNRGGWEGSGPLGRVAERALLRREQDSRKAIHHLKNLQSRHMQDFKDRVTLSQAVNSICGPQTSSNYINIDNDLVYMDQTVSSNVLDTNVVYTNEDCISKDPITSTFPTNDTTSNNVKSSIGTAMSQYVTALKNAGLPTDLPILFESGDGSYINVNEQVLLDMVQSSEIQYEVVEQPNIIEKVADPSEIKSIDDLSKSIERSEMLLNKSFTSTDDFKDTNYSQQDSINSLNAILPDSLESFAEQQNYVVLDPPLQETNNTMDQVNNDFSCIDGDMQFFTKSMSDEVKKYYDDQHLSDARVMEQICPASTTLDTSFNMSLLDSKTSHLETNLNTDELHKTACYDFTSNGFKEDALECLMATPKRTDDDQSAFDVNVLDEQANKERDEIIKELINIENNICINKTCDIGEEKLNESNQSDNLANENRIMVISNDTNKVDDMTVNSSDLKWADINEISEESITQSNSQNVYLDSEHENPANLTETTDEPNRLADTIRDIEVKKENDPIKCEHKQSTLEEDIPFAVGLLPLKQMQPTEESCLLKRCSADADLLDVDAKCLKRKAKCKKL